VTRTDELARALVGAWRSGAPLSAGEARRLAPLDEGGAYRVQAEVAAALGWFPGGRPRAWKIAAPKAGQPKAAPVPDAFLVDSPARLPYDGFHTLVGIELELAVRLDRDLAADVDREAVSCAVGATMAAIEVFDVRAADWRSAPATFLLADQQMHARLVLGTGVRGPWSDRFAACELVFEVNGCEISRRRGGHPLGDPLQALPWLARHAAVHAGGLRRGDLVSTGTWVALYEAEPGDHVRARFEGVGEVEFLVEVPVVREVAPPSPR